MAVAATAGCRLGTSQDRAAMDVEAATKESEAWRAKHEADYRREWVTIAGLHFLETGLHTAGSAPSNDIVLPPSAPPVLGRFVLEGDAVRFEPQPGSAVSLNDKIVSAPIRLADDGEAKADELAVGDVRLVVHRSGQRKSLRVWDPGGELARGFLGFTWFPIQMDYRVTGRFIPDATPREMQVMNTFGDLDTFKTEGVVEFTVQGQTLRLRPFTTRPKRFYFVFRDASEAAIPIFKEAIEHDGEFALAYAEIALIYYYLDLFQAEKKFAAEMNSYADKALLFDPKLANSLVAKALYYMHNKEYDLAVPYLEKALEYTPNSILAINFLALIYNNNIPNTTKYLEYALKAVRLEANAQDSATTSNNYLRLCDALIQTGFVDEALKFCNKSLDYNPKNFFSRWVKVFILYSKDKDLNKAKQLLLQELKKDTTQLVMVEEIAKVHYLMGDFEGAYPYYKRFLELKDAYHLDIFKNEDLKIGIVLEKVGQKEKAQEFINSFKTYADNDKSIYKHLNLAGYYAYLGDDNKSIEHMKLFSKEDNLKYWVLLFDSDPIVEAVKDHPEFDKVMGDIEKKFWKTHEEIKVTLEEKGLL